MIKEVMNLYYEPVIFKEECFMMIFVTLTFIAIFAFSDLANFLADKLNDKENRRIWAKYQQDMLDYEKGKRKDYPCIEKYFPYGIPRDHYKYNSTNTKK